MIFSVVVLFILLVVVVVVELLVLVVFLLVVVLLLLSVVVVLVVLVVVVGLVVVDVLVVVVVVLGAGVSGRSVEGGGGTSVFRISAHLTLIPFSIMHEAVVSPRSFILRQFFKQVLVEPPYTPTIHNVRIICTIQSNIFMIENFLYEWLTECLTVGE